MSEKTIKHDRSRHKRITRSALARLESAVSTGSEYRKSSFGKRKKIGVLDTEPKQIGRMPEGLTAQQEEMLDGLIRRFTIQKVNKYLKDQVKHINYKNHLGESMRLLFDEHGRPPANAPLEEIIAAREKIEAEIHMLEAICSAMRVSLGKLKEIEDQALEYIHGQFEK
jgi:hypothetical protein